MKKKILALLEAKFQGVRNDSLDCVARAISLQAATEEEARAIVDKLTDAQVTAFSKDYRTEVDKEVSESTQKFEMNLKRKYDLVEKKIVIEPGGDDDQKPADQNDVAAIVKAAVAEAVKPFQEKLAGYETASTNQSRLQALNDKLIACKDENFKVQTLKDFSRMKFESADAFNEYLTDKERDIETANQNLADAALRTGGGSPLFSQKEENGVSKGVAEFVESQKPTNDQFMGKEV